MKSLLQAVAEAAAPTVLGLLARGAPSVAELLRESTHPLASRVRVRDVVPDRLPSEQLLDELRKGRR